MSDVGIKSQNGRICFKGGHGDDQIGNLPAAAMPIQFPRESGVG